MITVYTKDNCPNCVKAKSILVSQGIDFETIQINDDNIESLRTSGARNAPAIFLDDIYMGSYRELKAFVRDSK